MFTRRNVLKALSNLPFGGLTAADALSGRIFLGEYLNASFTGKKHNYSTDRNNVNIQEGPPLAI